MKNTFLILLFTSVFATTATAACKTNQVNGFWHATYLSAESGDIGACVFNIKGNRLLNGSNCSNVYGDLVKLKQTRVKLDKSICVMEITWQMDGERFVSSHTIDRQVTVANGIYLSNTYGYAGIMNLVKKN